MWLILQAGQKTSGWYPVFDVATPSYIPIGDLSISYEEENSIYHPSTTVVNIDKSAKQNNERHETYLVDSGTIGVTSTSEHFEKPLSTKDIIIKSSFQIAQFSTSTESTTLFTVGDGVIASSIPNAMVFLSILLDPLLANDGRVGPWNDLS